MAHFAELDANNVVLRVIVVNNDDTSDANGIEKEYIGAAHCEKILGGRWVQTSYNKNFRKVFAGIGYTYNEEKDAFVRPKPFDAWTLNEETLDWDPPVPYPTDGKMYHWNNDISVWEETDLPATPTI